VECKKADDIKKNRRRRIIRA